MTGNIWLHLYVIWVKTLNSCDWNSVNYGILSLNLQKFILCVSFSFLWKLTFVNLGGFYYRQRFAFKVLLITHFANIYLFPKLIVNLTWFYKISHFTSDFMYSFLSQFNIPRMPLYMINKTAVCSFYCFIFSKILINYSSYHARRSFILYNNMFLRANV